MHLQVLLGLTQDLHRDNSLLHQMPPILQDLLDHIQEPLLDNSQMHQMPHTLQDPIQELLLGNNQGHQMLHFLHNLLGLMQECPQGHSQGLPLGPILMHLGNTLVLNILQVLLELTLPLLEHIQMLQDKAPHQVAHILPLMVSQVLQVLDRVGLGVLIHGVHRVASIQQTQICHTQPLVNFRLLVLHHLYLGVLCPLVNGGHLLHFLGLLDHTLNQAPIHEAVCSSGYLQTPRNPPNFPVLKRSSS